jgi:hypothetical protein
MTEDDIMNARLNGGGDTDSPIMKLQVALAQQELQQSLAGPIQMAGYDIQPMVPSFEIENITETSWTPPDGIVATDFGVFSDGAPIGPFGDAGKLVAAGGVDVPEVEPPAEPGSNNAPRIPAAPERLFLDDLSPQSYADVIRLASMYAGSKEREKYLTDQILRLDPNFRFDSIVTSRDSGFRYEDYLAEQLGKLWVAQFGPVGMKVGQWTAFRQEVNESLQDSPYPRATAFMRGSSVTGFSYRTKMTIDLSGPSDFDAAIVSPELFGEMRSEGIPLYGARGGDRTIPLSSEVLESYGIRGLPSRVNNIPVSYMIYSSGSAMAARPGFAVPLALPRK